MELHCTPSRSAFISQKRGGTVVNAKIDEVQAGAGARLRIIDFVPPEIIAPHGSKLQVSCFHEIRKEASRYWLG